MRDGVDISADRTFPVARVVVIATVGRSFPTGTTARTARPHRVDRRPAVYQTRYDEIDIPVLHISGWYDDEAVGTPRNFNGMRSGGSDEFGDDRPVCIFVMGANEWREEPSWPPPYVEPARPVRPGARPRA
jgi:predicted acyl esterase